MSDCRKMIVITQRIQVHSQDDAFVPMYYYGKRDAGENGSRSLFHWTNLRSGAVAVEDHEAAAIVLIERETDFDMGFYYDFRTWAEQAQ